MFNNIPLKPIVSLTGRIHMTRDSDGLIDSFREYWDGGSVGRVRAGGGRFRRRRDGDARAAGGGVFLPGRFHHDPRCLLRDRPHVSVVCSLEPDDARRAAEPI